MQMSQHVQDLVLSGNDDWRLCRSHVDTSNPLQKTPENKKNIPSSYCFTPGISYDKRMKIALSLELH